MSWGNSDVVINRSRDQEICFDDQAIFNYDLVCTGKIVYAQGEKQDSITPGIGE